MLALYYSEDKLYMCEYICKSCSCCFFHVHKNDAYWHRKQNKEATNEVKVFNKKQQLKTETLIIKKPQEYLVDDTLHIN